LFSRQARCSDVKVAGDHMGVFPFEPVFRTFCKGVKVCGAPMRLRVDIVL